MIVDSYPLQIFFAKDMTCSPILAKCVQTWRTLKEKHWSNCSRGYDLFAFSWNQNFVRCLRNRADGGWGKLICRVSSYGNRLISFSNFSQTIRRLCSLLLLNVYKPGLLAKKSIEAIAPESPRERYIYSVPVWLPSVYILPRWIQSMIIYLGMNVLTIGELVFSGIGNTKCKQ